MRSKRKGRSYKDDIKIDRDALEECWLEQGALMQYYTELLANAIKEKDVAKIQIDYTYAQIDSRTRKYWKNHFEVRPTEAALKSFILNHGFYKKAQKRLIEAHRIVNIMNGVKSSFEHRKKALENLVSLKLYAFHSEPRTKNRGDQIRDSIDRRNNEESKTRTRGRSRKTNKR